MVLETYKPTKAAAAAVVESWNRCVCRRDLLCGVATNKVKIIENVKWK